MTKPKNYKKNTDRLLPRFYHASDLRQLYTAVVSDVQEFLRNFTRNDRTDSNGILFNAITR